MSPALQSAAYRFASVLIALLVAAGVWYLIPDPDIKAAAGGLAVAAIFALEEAMKNSGPVVTALRPHQPVTPAPVVVPVAPVAPVVAPVVTAAATVEPVAPAPVTVDPQDLAGMRADVERILALVSHSPAPPAPAEPVASAPVGPSVP